MMEVANFIVREPLLDTKGQIIGYELTWEPGSDYKGDPNEAEANLLALIVAEELNDAESGWKLRDTALFLNIDPVSFDLDAAEALPPARTVFSLRSESLSNPEMPAAVKALREKGYGISLKHADLTAQNKGLLPLLTHVEVSSDAVDMATQAKLFASLRQSSVKMVSRDIKTWEQYAACSSMGAEAFVGNLYLTPRPDIKSKGLNPAQTMILQLMQLVKKNADVWKLEEILRRDAALSYKLLRYINSVGFGLGSEIQSLRHAVTMLGYSPLYRWLSLLLATASTGENASMLMQTAVVRGRLAELLAHGFVPKNETENLFVAGMFSLLDRLLGVPMEEVLENIQLSDSISQALLSREGVYGPFLALAEACESHNGKAAELADSLFVSAHHVNEAHLAALAWVQNLNIS